ncbi:YlxM family DNA-binding protein [Acidaminobacterium chupaoyuni]
MKSDTFHMSMLFDFYGELLTEKQKELFDLYYNEDLSLTEISEIAGITRQGVRDAIVRAETILRETEDRVCLVRRYAGIQAEIEKITQSASMIAMANSTGPRNYEIAKQVDQIIQIAGKLSE